MLLIRVFIVALAVTMTSGEDRNKVVAASHAEE